MSDSKHRSGVWVQKNKTHKHGQHRSKGDLRTEQKGRIMGLHGLKNGKKQPIGKVERRNQKLQKRTLQQFQTLREKQKTESVPLDVLLVPLSDHVSATRFLALLKSHEDAPDEEMPHGDAGAAVFLKFARYKICMNFRTADLKNLWGTLDLAKTSDLILFLHDPFEELSEEVAEVLSSLLGQGLPAVIHCAYIELERDNNAQVFLKERSDVKKQIVKRIDVWFPDPQLEFVCGSADLPTFLFRLSNVRPSSTEYREMRPYLTSLSSSFVPAADKPDTGTLEVRGILKGGVLEINAGVHIVGLGNFLLESVEVQSNKKGRRISKVAPSTGLGPGLRIAADPSQQESLSDVLADEQEDESMEQLSVDPNAVTSQKKRFLKMVPKGTSQYQAAWIVDAEEKDLLEEEPAQWTEDDDMEVAGEADSITEELQEPEHEGSDTEYEEDSAWELTFIAARTGPGVEEARFLSKVDEKEDKDSVGYDARVNAAEEREAYVKAKELVTDAMFPDEVDTPKHVSARVRFFKYRGIDNFRGNSGDMEDNLPKEYGKISKFSNVIASKKAALDFGGKVTVKPYNLTSIWIKEVPKSVMELPNPLIIYGLLAHEHQMTLLNLSIRRCNGYSEPIRCNEELVFQVGFRRFKAKALLSELSPGKLHKYLRFMPSEGHFVASVYAPITFPPAPVLVYKEVSEGSLTVLGVGTLLSLDPDRVVLKRAVLSGHPFKINVRSAVIRFMFFNKEDVDWFRKVKLTTKHGRVGEIKEPLGTHGHMKCRFDGQLQSSDTVLLKLYKRAFPKWSFTPLSLTPPLESMES